jgi:hypothetical protein
VVPAPISIEPNCGYRHVNVAAVRRVVDSVILRPAMGKTPASDPGGEFVHPLDGLRGVVVRYPLLSMPLISARPFALNFDAMAIMDGANPNPKTRNVLVHTKIDGRWWLYPFFSDDLEDVCSWIPWSH